jgi:NADPH-dependent curcumin reductase CurA
MKTKQIVLASRPKGTPIAKNFRTETIELAALEDGEVLLKPNYFSVDPYMRGRMNDAKSYSEPFKVDMPLYGAATATVQETKSDLFKKGDTVVGSFYWQEQMVVSDKSLKKIDLKIAPESYHLGVLGMTGLTAYFGLIDIGKPKKGETVVVSGAAGAVGVVVGQIAKIQGCRVIGITGSDEKLTLLKEEFGFDEVINYKTSKNLQKDIAKVCPNGVDIYFDNVGGEISDAVIATINFKARIALCGQIALYNSTDIPMGPRLQPMLLTRSVLMQGFIVGNFSADFPKAKKQLNTWVKEGKIKFTETIENGFSNLPKALIGLFSGENTGKMIVKV